MLCTTSAWFWFPVDSSVDRNPASFKSPGEDETSGVGLPFPPPPPGPPPPPPDEPEVFLLLPNKLLIDSEIVSQKQGEELLNESKELLKIFSASRKTAKENLKISKIIKSPN